MNDGQVRVDCHTTPMLVAMSSYWPSTSTCEAQHVDDLCSYNNCEALHHHINDRCLPPSASICVRKERKGVLLCVRQKKKRGGGVLSLGKCSTKIFSKLLHNFSS